MKQALWWGIVVIAWLYVGPATVVFLPFFALGLTSKAVLSVGLWSFYIAITIAAFRAKTRWGYLLLYTLFCVVVLMNAAGCKRVVDDLIQLR